MAKFYFYLLVFVCSFSSIAVAGEQLPKCFTYRYSVEITNADELRSVAATCPIVPLAKLYFNRAYHLDFVEANVLHQNIQRLGSDDLGRVLESYRMYIALIEVFATRSRADIVATVATMNRGYEDAAEVVELRFLGYEQRANWVEKMRPMSTVEPE